MEHNEELRMAWDFVEKTGTNIFLTGKAGTGKTTFLRKLRERSPKRMVVLAPTGIAAINAGGVTIHSFFQLPLSPYIPGASFSNKEKKYFQFSKVKRSIIKTLDLLVIDEISMVRADLLDAVDSVMRRYRVHDQPFGGVQLLLIGDLQQLAPVVKEAEWELMRSYYDTPYFFSSKALGLTPYQTIELKKVYRQQDDSFIGILNKIRENRADENTLAALNSRYVPNFTPPIDSDFIRLVTHNFQADQINNEQLSLLKTQEHSYRAKIDGNFPEYAYPAEEVLTLKAGAQVMFIKNDTEHRYYNGMIGEVIQVDKDDVVVRSKETGEDITLTPAEWINAKYTLNEENKEIEETVEGTFRQYPLRLAWAITIHKSQGLTFNHAIIDASRSFAHGQTYVALSRCKTLEGMVLSAPLNRSAIISDNTVDNFIARAEQNQPTEEVLGAMQKQYVAKILNEFFDFSPLKQALMQVLRLLNEHFYKKHPELIEDYNAAAKAIDEMLLVARKFEAQYTAIIYAEAGTGSCDNPVLQERIHKAAGYFLGCLESMKELPGKSQPDTRNKLLLTQLKDRLALLQEELKLKIGLLHHEASAGTIFSVRNYLHTKAQILLGDEIVEKKPARQKQKKEKAPKEEKKPSREVTYEMYLREMSVQEIALERNLAESTVFSHLTPYVESGEIPLCHIIPQQHIEEIIAFTAGHPTAPLSEIKNGVSSSISYDEIKLVMKSR